MLIEDDAYKNDPEQICDDIIVMFIAGSKTVQSTTTNLISMYMINEELRTKLHAELDPLVEKVKGDWVNDFTYEMTEDLVYTKNAYYETMRYDTPIAISSTNTVTQACTIDGIPIEPGIAFFINMEMIHKDPDEW